jgi:hypothetical protein
MAPSSSIAVRTFGYCRIVLGASSVIAPRFACGLFNFLISNETAAVVRMFGIRGVALGALILTAGNSSSSEDGGRELRRTLWANTSCDIVDICILLWSICNGHIDRLPGGLLAGGAATCVGLGLLGLKTA